MGVIYLLTEIVQSDGYPAKESIPILPYLVKQAIHSKEESVWLGEVIINPQITTLRNM
jgi:hypothetical protein